MANKTLHSLQFPGLSDTYILPEEASEFSTSSTYAVGQYVTYRGILYKCITAVTNAGSWTGATNWSATDVGTELQDTYGPSKPNFSVNNPVMDGTASPGTATTYARSDHRHPSDTNKLNIPDNAGTVGQALTKTATGSTWKTLTEGINPNLLRNWYFVGGGTGRGVFPVNSRGSNSYSSTSGINCIDGWRMFRGTITINSSDIYLVRDYSAGGGYAPFHQNIDGYNDLIGKKVTASLLQDDNTLYYDTFTVPSTGTYMSSPFNDTFRFYMNSPSSSSFEIGLVSTNATLHIKAIKLELGDQQTLAHQENGAWVLNEIPDYEEEYYRCITSSADSGDTYANKSLATEQQLAYIETGITASRAYAVGECFCWNGLLYRATAAISNGGTIIPGTNCTQTTAATKPGMRLLWENSNTGTAFAETTCAGTGGFGTYIIVCRVSATAQSYVTFVVSSFIIGESQVITYVSSPANSIPVISFRSVTKQDTGLLTISNCASRTVTSTSRTQANTDLVPARIYGVY